LGKADAETVNAVNANASRKTFIGSKVILPAKIKRRDFCKISATLVDLPVVTFSVQIVDSPHKRLGEPCFTAASLGNSALRKSRLYRST
jgi:hypothetical protein